MKNLKNFLMINFIYNKFLENEPNEKKANFIFIYI